MNTFWQPLRSLTVAMAVLVALLTSMNAGAALAATHVDHNSRVKLLKPGNPGTGDEHPPPLGDPTLPRATFMGQITAIDGPDTADPSGFVLELGVTSEDIKLVPKTMITGKTAEAVVEGLATQDYAVVRAKRYKGTWYATRVVFDVQPVAPLRLVSGTIIRITKDLKHYVIKPDAGKGNTFVRVGKLTRFHIDDRPVDGPPADWTFGVADIAAQTLMRRENGVWTAYDIYTRSTPVARR